MAQDEAMLLRRFAPVVVAAVVGIGVIAFFGHRHFSRPAANSEPRVIAEKASASSGVPSVPSPVAVETEGQVAPSEPIRAISPRMASEVQSAEPAAARPLEPEPPQETPQEDRTSELDLSSPQATATTFIKMFAGLDAESVTACMAPNGVHYHDVQAILQVQPGEKGYDKKLCLQAFDPEAEMPVIDQRETPDGVEITWLVTFKTDFVMESQPFDAGEQVRFSAMMVPVDGQWLIDSIMPNLRRD